MKIKTKVAALVAVALGMGASLDASAAWQHKGAGSPGCRPPALNCVAWLTGETTPGGAPEEEEAVLAEATVQQVGY